MSSGKILPTPDPGHPSRTTQNWETQVAELAGLEGLGLVQGPAQLARHKWIHHVPACSLPLLSNGSCHFSLALWQLHPRSTTPMLHKKHPHHTPCNTHPKMLCLPTDTLRRCMKSPCRLWQSILPIFGETRTSPAHQRRITSKQELLCPLHK